MNAMLQSLLQVLLSALLVAWSGSAVHAQDGARDPMRAPAAALPPPAPPASPHRADASDPTVAATTAVRPRHLMVVDGRHYVMVGTRRLGVGDLLGTARIERIEDAAVVVREAGALQRLPLYASAPSRPESASAAGAARPASAPRRGAPT